MDASARPTLPGEPPAPELDLSPAARAARHQARLRALRSARRAAWIAAAGDPDAFRRHMAAWIAAGRPGPGQPHNIDPVTH